MSIFAQNRALLDAFRRGDNEALTEVYLHSVDSVERLVRQLLRRHLKSDEEDRVRDLLQDIFIRAFSAQARLSYDGLRPYRPFLLQIARNRVIDDLRKSGREILLDDLDSGFDLDLVKASEQTELQDGNSPEEALHWKKLQEATQEYIATLSELLRSFVRLRFEQELGQRAVAEHLGLSRWRVRSLEKKVQDGLRRFLRRRGLIKK